MHLDGARIFNAATALGVPVSQIAEHVTSVQFCLSKVLFSYDSTTRTLQQTLGDIQVMCAHPCPNGMKFAYVLSMHVESTCRPLIPPVPLSIEPHGFHPHSWQGLGAPAGSIVAGPKAFIAKVFRYRKMLGGGMRQSGVLAAPGSSNQMCFHSSQLTLTI